MNLIIELEYKIESEKFKVVILNLSAKKIEIFQTNLNNY